MKTIYHILALAAAVLGVTACKCGGEQAADEPATPDPATYQSANTENMQQVRDFLHQAGCYFLATVDGDQPQVRPFGTAEIIEGKLYIQTGHVKNVAKQIAANPKVAICAYNAADGRWLRISATLQEDPRVEIKKAMLDALKVPAKRRAAKAPADDTPPPKEAQEPATEAQGGEEVADDLLGVI